MGPSSAGETIQAVNEPTRITDQCCRDCRWGRVVRGVASRPNRYCMGCRSPTVVTANTASNIVSIAGGYDKLLALRDDRTVWSSEADVPPGLTNVIAIAAGYQTSLALTADGTLIRWPAVDTLVGI